MYFNMTKNPQLLFLRGVIREFQSFRGVNTPLPPPLDVYVFRKRLIMEGSFRDILLKEKTELLKPKLLYKVPNFPKNIQSKGGCALGYISWKEF